MEWVDIVLKVVIIGLAAWVIRGAVKFKAKLQALEDKIPTMPDCDKVRKEVKQEVMELCVGELKHVRELIEQRLTQGEKTFAEQGEAIKETNRLLTDIRLDLAEIAKNGKA